ncbi:MAG: hypothetical protein ACFBRM_00495 [Pikeienuella sp.]
MLFDILTGETTLADRLQEIRENLEERFGETRQNLEDRLDDFRALKEQNDPDRLELIDFDSSEDWTVGESENGRVVITGPNGNSRETILDYGDDTDSFEDIGNTLRDRIENREADFEALKGLTGEQDELEASDLDASLDFNISESEDGNAVIELRLISFETSLEFAEYDSFQDLVDRLDEIDLDFGDDDDDDDTAEETPVEETPLEEAASAGRELLADILDGI